MSDQAADTFSDNDLLFQADVKDNTQAFFDKFDANVQKADQTAQTGFNGVSTSANKSNTALAAVAGVVAGITTFLVGMAKAGVEEFANMLQEAYKVTEAYDKMAATMYIVGQNAGYNSKQMDTFVAGMKAADMSSMGAVQSLTKMAQAQLDLTKSQALATVAADASAVSGQTQAAAMDEIVRSIEVLSPRLLRTMGIYVDMTKEEKKYAEAHNTTVAALDQSTKQQIMLNAILDQGKNIQGAYAAAMQTAAGQEMKQAQLTDEFNLAIGRLVQPVLLQWLKTANGLLSDLLGWLDKNKTGIEAFSNDFGNSFALLIKSLTDFVNSANTGTTDVMNFFDRMVKSIVAGNKTAENSVDDFFSRLTNLHTAADSLNKVFIMYEATAKGMYMEVGAVVAAWAIAFSNLGQVLEGKMSVTDYATSLKQLFAVVTSGDVAYNEFKKSVAEQIPLMQDVTKVTNDAAAAAAAQANALKQEGDAVDALDQNLTDLQKKLEEDKATAAIKAQRDVIEAELRDSWARQDMAKNLADNITQIEQNSQDQRVQLVQQYADQRWQIEHNYQIALKQLEEQFDYDTSEAARRRDAVSMLALVRKNEQDVKKLKEGKTQQEDDAKRSFDKLMKDQTDALAKQIKQANDSYNKQLADFAQSKDREKQIQDLHDKWAQEDIQRATDKQLQTFIDQYNGMDGATKDGLKQILTDWGSYFTDLWKLINANAPGISNTINNMLRPGERNPYTPVTPSNPRPGERGGSVTGQAGLVTSMLTPYGMRAAALDTASTSRVPSVHPQSDKSGHRSVDVNVAGNALDPYIQRIMVRDLMEIERNAS